MTAYAGRVVGLLQEEYGPQASDEQQQAVATIKAQLRESIGTVTAAARAIALHNITPGLPGADTAAAHGLTPTRFQLRLGC
jgi:hypothetical protein